MEDNDYWILVLAWVGMGLLCAFLFWVVGWISRRFIPKNKRGRLMPVKKKKPARRHHYHQGGVY